MKKGKKLISSNNNRINLKKYLTKANITYFILFVIDVILVICLARKNIVNYVVISSEKFFVSKTRYLLWGRNYVNLIVIAFFYIYTCLINKYFLRRKNSGKFMGCLLFILLLLNCMLFVVFTKRVY